MIARTFAMHEYDGLPDDPDTRLKAVTIATVLEVEEVDTQELPTLARRIATDQRLAAYKIDDRRTYTEIGASGAGQELILSLISSATGPAVAGISGAVANQVIQWAREHQQRNREAMGSAQEDQTALHTDLEGAVFAARSTVHRCFGISEEQLLLDDARDDGGNFSVSLTAAGTEDNYSVEITDAGNIVKVVRASQESKSTEARG